MEKRIEQISDEEFCKGTLALDFESAFPKGTGDQVDYKFDRDRLCVCVIFRILLKRESKMLSCCATSMFGMARSTELRTKNRMFGTDSPLILPCFDVQRDEIHMIKS